MKVAWFHGDPKTVMKRVNDWLIARPGSVIKFITQSEGKSYTGATEMNLCIWYM